KFIFSKYNFFIILIFFIFCFLTFFIVKNYFKTFFYDFIQENSLKYNFVLKDINISGINRLDKKNINNIIAKNIGNSILLIPLNKIRKDIKKIVWVEDFVLKLDYPSSINIEIKEKIPVAIYEENGNYYFIDEFGEAIDLVKNPSYEDLILISGESSKLQINELLKLLNLYKDLQVKYAYYVGSRRWDIITINNLKIKLPEKEYSKALKNLNEVFVKIGNIDYNLIEFIDLRVPNKAIIRFYDEENVDLMNDL
ncbi:MAG: Cell division protein FtsQ, partial [Alphaproteobacteria bacterium MarineAlpha5_Bin11]